MLSQASFTHSLGFKLKKIPAFNTSVTRTMLDPSFSMTPKHSKKISSPLLNTMVTFTPKATHSRVNSLTMNPESPQAKQLPGSPPNKLIKCRISREGTRNLEDLLAPKPKAVDRLELKLISTLNRENKTPLSVTPKTPGKIILNFSNAISNIQIGSKKKVLVLPSKASEFVVSSAGQVLKRLPIKDQWRSLSPVGQSQTPQPQSVKMTTPGGQENQKIRFINKTPEEDGEENKTNYALFSQNSYAPQGSEGDEMPRTGSKFIKVKSQILKSWEEYKIKRDFLISKDGEDGMTDDNCIDGVDNGELSYERSKAKLTSVSQREPGTLDTEKHCCDRLIRREDRQHGENLSPDSGYNWQDRHNATMARKGQGQMVMKMKPKVGLGQEDLDCFVNVTLKYSGDPSFQSKKVKKLNYDLQLKKNREEGRKKLSAIRGYCKEVVTHGESHWKSGDRVVEKNNS